MVRHHSTWHLAGFSFHRKRFALWQRGGWWKLDFCFILSPSFAWLFEDLFRKKHMRGTSAIVKIISQSATSISSTPEGWLDIMVIVFHQGIQQRTNHNYGHLGTCDQQHRAHSPNIFDSRSLLGKRPWHDTYSIMYQDANIVGILWKTCNKFRTLPYHSVSYLDDTLSFECCRQNVLQAQSPFIARVVSKSNLLTGVHCWIL